MRFHQKKLSFAVLHVLGAGLAAGAVALPASAQQAQKIEKIEITGSNIKRIEGETALPVTVITRQDIERSGAVNTEDILRRITASTAMFSDTTQGVGYAQSNANLRGLGGSSTLVLLNGRRLANHAFGNIGGTVAVDLNAIPFSAIERVEVLRDGASAVYGTDAVGGVINFITRSDYRGAEIGLMYGDTEGKTGGRETGVTMSYGAGDLGRDRWNVLITGRFQYNQRVRAIDQKLYNRYTEIDGALDPTSFRGFPGRIMDFGISPGAYSSATANPNFAACDPEFTVVQQGGVATPSGQPTLRCRGLFVAYLDNLPDTHKTDVYGKFTYDISSNHQLFADVSFARNHNIGRIAPVPIDQTATHVKPDGTQSNVLLPITSRYAPMDLIRSLGFTDADLITPGFLEIAYRSADIGNRINDVTNDQFRVSTGLKGLIAGWDYNTAITLAQSKVHLIYTGYVHEQRFVDALRTGNLNPFGPNDAVGQQLLAGTIMEGDMRDSQSTTTQVDGKVSRELFSMAGGPFAAAFGVDFRREEIDDKPVNDDYRQGLHVGGEGTIPDVNASRNVFAAFAEVNMPVTRQLELAAAVRYDRYSDLGSKTNPRISARFMPNKDLLFRASAGTGFRAPSLWDLKSPPSFTNSANQLNDPGCPAALIAAGDARCVQTQLNVRNSASADLKAETSRQWNVGMVLEPMQAVSLALDYWYIEKKDQIGQVDADTILANPDDLTLYNRYSSRFVRNAAGTTLFVNQPVENLGKLRTSGWDLDVRARLNPGAGRMILSFAGTYLTKWEQQNGKDEPFTVYLGNSLNGGDAYPRWNHVAAIDYTLGMFTGTIEQTYTAGWTEQFQLGGTHRIPSVSRLNLAATVRPIPKLAVKVGVRNVLDHLPPFTDVSSSGSHAQGYANSVADPRGRFWYTTLTYTFK